MLDIIVSYTKKIESILEKEFSARGKGLHTKVSSVENILCPNIARKIHQIASIRNKSMHNDKYVVGDITDFISECNFVLEYLSYDTTELTENESSPEDKKNCKHQLNEIGNYLKWSGRLKIGRKTRLGNTIIYNKRLITSEMLLNLFLSKDTYSHTKKQINRILGSDICHQKIMDIENILGNYNLMVRKSNDGKDYNSNLFVSISITFVIILAQLNHIINAVEKMKISSQDLNSIVEDGILKISTESLCGKENFYKMVGALQLLSLDSTLKGEDDEKVNILYEFTGYGVIKKLASKNIISYPKRGKVLQFNNNYKKAKIAQGEYITLNLKNFGIEPKKKNMDEIYSYLKKNIFEEYDNDKLHRNFPIFATCIYSSVYVFRLKLHGHYIPCYFSKFNNDCL